MKKLSILIILVTGIFTHFQSYAQVQETSNIAQVKQIEKKALNKKVKVDLEDIPHSVLLSLRNSYAKHFVMKAYKTNEQINTYFVELQKDRKWFTVAITNKGRVLKEIHENDISNQNSLADKN